MIDHVVSNIFATVYNIGVFTIQILFVNVLVDDDSAKSKKTMMPAQEFKHVS